MRITMLIFIITLAHLAKAEEASSAKTEAPVLTAEERKQKYEETQAKYKDVDYEKLVEDKKTCDADCQELKTYKKFDPAKSKFKDIPGGKIKKEDMSGYKRHY